MQSTTSTTPPATAAGLRDLFRAEGYKPGIPPGLDNATLAIDLKVYGRQRCPRCRRCLTVSVYTDGRRHRLLCACKRDGYATEG